MPEMEWNQAVKQEKGICCTFHGEQWGDDFFGSLKSLVFFKKEWQEACRFSEKNGDFLGLGICCWFEARTKAFGRARARNLFRRWSTETWQKQVGRQFWDPPIWCQLCTTAAALMLVVFWVVLCRGVMFCVVLRNLMLHEYTHIYTYFIYIYTHTQYMTNIIRVQMVMSMYVVWLIFLGSGLTSSSELSLGRMRNKTTRLGRDLWKTKALASFATMAVIGCLRQAHLRGRIRWPKIDDRF